MKYCTVKWDYVFKPFKGSLLKQPVQYNPYAPYGTGKQMDYNPTYKLVTSSPITSTAGIPPLVQAQCIRSAKVVKEVHPQATRQSMAGCQDAVGWTKKHRGKKTCPKKLSYFCWLLVICMFHLGFAFLLFTWPGDSIRALFIPSWRSRFHPLKGSLFHHHKKVTAWITWQELSEFLLVKSLCSILASWICFLLFTLR